MRTTLVRLMFAISLGALMPACSEPEESSESSIHLTPIDKASRINRILVQKGSANEPNVCVIKRDGDVSCHASNQKLPYLPAIQNFGPLMDADGSCFLKKTGQLVCGLTGNQTIVQNKVSKLKAIRMMSGNRLCAISDIDGPDAARCYFDPASTTGKDLLDSHPNISGNTNASLVKIETVELTPGGDATFCGLTANGKLACAVVGVDNTVHTPFPKLPRVAEIKDFGLTSQNLCTVNAAQELSCYRLSDAAAVPVPAEVPRTNVVDLTGSDNTLCARYTDGDFRCWTPTAVYPRSRFNVVERAEKVDANRFGICAAFADDSVRCLEPASGSVVSYEADKANFLQSSGEQTCSVDAQGKLRCWNNRQPYTPPARLNVISGNEFAVGRNHLCFVNGSSVSCQGAQNQGQLRVPTFSAAPTSVKAAADHSCALDRNGAVQCWGDNTFGQLNPPQNLQPAQKIFAGPKMNCALVRTTLDDGQSSDQLRCWGDAALVEKVPQDAQGFREIAIGENHACAIRRDRTMSCWGDNTAGQRQPRFILQALSVAAGRAHSCAVLTDRSLGCWGDDSFGQISVPSDLGPVRRVVAGDSHTCAVTQSGRVRCWGQREAGLKAKAEKESGSRMLASYPVRGRSVGKDQTIFSCTTAPCNLPDEPFVSFPGYGYGLEPDKEHYKIDLQVDVSAECPASLRFVVNGQIVKAPPVAVNGTITTSITAGPNSSRLSGPALIQIRNLDSLTKKLTSLVPARCSIKLKNLIFNPDSETIDTWKAVAIQMDSALEGALKRYITEAAERNATLIRNGELKTLLTIIKNDFIGQVQLFLELSKTTEENRLPSFDYLDLSSERMERDLLMETLLDPLFGTVYKIKDVLPAWYSEIPDSELYDQVNQVSRAATQLTQAATAIESGVIFSAQDLASATRDLLGGELKAEIQRASSFLRETELLSAQLLNASNSLNEARGNVKGENIANAKKEVFGP